MFKKKLKHKLDWNRIIFLSFPATFLMLIFLTYPFVLIIYLINLISLYFIIKKKTNEGIRL